MNVITCILCAAVVVCVVVNPADCQTAAPISRPCAAFSTCDSCVQNAKCLWCQTNGSCADYPIRSLLPPPSLCRLAQARWGVCWVNFEAVIIAMAVLGGTILISLSVCCFCCCCCKKSQSRPDRDEESFARRREEIRQRSDERRVERKTKHDEIRKKYGLIPDSDHPYSKFEND